MNRIIKIGQIIKLIKKVGNKLEYISKVVDFNQSDMIMTIEMPTYQKQIIMLHVDERYEIELKMEEGIYKTEGLVLKRYKDGSIYLADILLLSKLQKHQRREYYRLDISQEIEYRFCTKEEHDIIEKIKNNSFSSKEEKIEVVKRLKVLTETWDKATATNVSAGGIKIITNKLLPVGEWAYIKISFADEILIILSFILFCEQIKDSEFYTVRLKFFEMSDKDKEKIIKYIFEQERKNRNKLNSL